MSRVCLWELLKLITRNNNKNNNSGRRAGRITSASFSDLQSPLKSGIYKHPCTFLIINIRSLIIFISVVDDMFFFIC